MTEDERAQRLAKNAERAELLRRHVKKGDILTHIVCAGSLAEHRFTHWEGLWLCGVATADTRRFSKFVPVRAHDIAPMNITHVNRDAVEALDVLATLGGA